MTLEAKGTHPLAQFSTDRRAASNAKDPMAAVCVLATVDDQGLPQARTLVLRDTDEGLAIYINASSPKWQQCQGRVTIQTWWPSVQIQYRMVVNCQPLAADHIANSWQLRPDVPKRMDWLYEQWPQGSAVTSREDLLQRLDETVIPEPLVAPYGARGLLLIPEKIERLNLNQSDGVHDRTCCQLQEGNWHKQTLIP